MRTTLLACASLAVSCTSTSSTRPRAVTASSTTARASSQQLAQQPVARNGECIEVELVENGTQRGPICIADAMSRGLTIIDLTDEWTPTILQPTSDGQVPSFRERYLALASETADDGKDDDGIAALAELYGVVPALSVVRGRLADDARHACQAAIDPAPIGKLERVFSQGDRDTVAAMEQGRRGLTAQLEREAKRRKLDAVAALEADPKWHHRYVRWRTLEDTHAALVTAQKKLGCEGWLDDKYADGAFTWRTGLAVESFQRRNFLMPTARLDHETRDAMLLDSHELDYRLALRVLRERVAEATGLIEDGTAGDGPQPIQGRMLDPPAMRAARGHHPLAHAAPDRIGAATDAAAKALGWTNPDAVRAFLEHNPSGVRVALALPAPPPYHAPHMELSVEIDRGDVWYDAVPPARKRIVQRRPTLVVFAQDGAIKRPLVRWPTTIGGWADQRLPGGQLVQKWKESDVGPRVWKDLTAGPSWLAPKSTPDKELVKNLYNGHWALRSEVFGPGPRSAYGLVLLEHVAETPLEDGTIRYDDNGIGTHGSASVTSIVNGTSHGCHRLYNQLATRLGDFLLHHRTHAVKGEAKVTYRRVVSHDGESFKVAIDSRGFQYELTPPVPVNVTKGRIRSVRKTPPKNSAPARP